MVDKKNKQRISIHSFLPYLQQWRAFNIHQWSGDVIAGIVVTVVIIPQAMAYAMLAGLPAEAGLYASILPLAIYGLFGGLPSLSVAPVAIDSLLIAVAIGGLAVSGGTHYWQWVIMLALMVGALQILFGLLRLGHLINFISDPVIKGFTNAAAIIIAVSQLRYIVGLDIPRSTSVFDTLQALIHHLGAANGWAAVIGLISIIFLLGMQRILPNLLKRRSWPETLVLIVSRSAPLILIIVMTVLSAYWIQSQDRSVAVIGSIPAHLPQLQVHLPDRTQFNQLLSPAVTIALISILQSVSVGKILSGRKRRRFDANREIMVFGLANIMASFSRGMVVSGGFGRSAVNDSAGAQSGLSSLLTAGLVLLTTLFFTPYLFYLPQAVLAAIIVAAVINLIDFKSIFKYWDFNKADVLAAMLTFLGVLFLGIQYGILAGVLFSIVYYLWHTSRPHLAVIGETEHPGHYRNVERHNVKTCPHVLALRVDESLYFANVNYLQTEIINLAAGKPQLQYLV
ncbi:MAG: sulfate permease, partial [Caldithrix sp.]|nr:sulfate permease [Caldithrix sp.]